MGNEAIVYRGMGTGGMGHGAYGQWGTGDMRYRGMGHMGNGSHGQWDTRGMGHMGNEAHSGVWVQGYGHRGYGVQGLWAMWAMGYRVMGHMGNGAHGQFAPKISKRCQVVKKMSNVKK